ncbi:hypothetical protein, partial [Sphingobium sp.]|uniref:hypothetical protein n=1 Tax=Sphingobium sp. TaxID=1912891 RepID=UPI002D7EC789
GIMTHKPAVPPASRAPYPPHPAPHAENIQADPTAEDTEIAQHDESLTRVTALGAAVGIGSAAIVAALLYVRHRKT